jgi:hypothetical protein
MTSRERVKKAINHIEPDKVPFDLGSTAITGISASSLTLLRKALNIYKEPVKVHEPYQMLGKVEMDLIERLGIDTIGINLPSTMFGFNADNWKPCILTDGTDVLVPGGFNTERDTDGNLYMYPFGDKSVQPSARMPKDGFYFDTIIRQEKVDLDNLKPEEWTDGMFNLLKDEELKYLEKLASDLYNNTSLSLVASIGSGGFGDIAYVPAPGHKNPKGIRDIQEWYLAHISYPEYIKGIFDIQLDILLKNYELTWQALGDKIDIMMVSGTDFGTQIGLYISLNMFREFYKPYHTKVNKWIHENTTWKTMYHSCGSIFELMDDLIESGVDILNPVQCSANKMDPKTLKEKYGNKIVFWGGGINTQKTLPFGTPEDVKKEVKERINIFGKGGGFVFNPIHNIQRGTPQENLVALVEAVEEYRNI